MQKAFVGVELLRVVAHLPRCSTRSLVVLENRLGGAGVCLARRMGERVGENVARVRQCLFDEYREPILCTILQGVTNTRISYIRSSSLSFPSIAICTDARINQTKIRELAVDEALLTYMLAAFSVHFSCSELSLPLLLQGTYLFYNDNNQRMDVDMLEYKYQQFLIDNGYNISSFRCKHNKRKQIS